jgi:hypothetical protein
VAIFNIEPKTSKITGGVIIDITGTQFEHPAFELIPLVSNVIDTSTTQATIEDKSNGLSLQVPELLSQRASFKINQLFPEAFKLKAEIELAPQSMPIIKNGNLVGIEIQDSLNPSKKVRYFITYNQGYGYQVVLEEKFGTSILYRKEEFINPQEITEISIDLCGKYLH